MEEENKNIEEPAVEPTPEVAPVEEMPTPIEPATDPAPVVQEEPKVMESAVVPEKKKGKGGLIFLLLLLVIGGGFAAWYFAFGGKDVISGKKEEPKQEEKKEESKEEEKKEESKEETKEEEKKEETKEEEKKEEDPTANLKFADISDSYQKVTYNGKTIELEVKEIQGDYLYRVLYIDGKATDIKMGSLNSISNVYQLGDKIIILTSGTDIRSYQLRIIDFTGKELKKIISLDEETMVIATKGMKGAAIEVKDDYLEFDGTRLTHGPSLVTAMNPMKEVEICNNNDLDHNTVVRATYRLNKKFEIEKVSGSDEYLKDVVAAYCK